jgi:biotin carboxylase
MQSTNGAKNGAASLADDPSKDIVLFINDFYPEYASAFHKLSERLHRPLRGILLVDRMAKEQNRVHPDKDHLFEEVVCDFSNAGELRATIKKFEDNLLLVSSSAESSQLDFKKVIPHVPYMRGPTEQSMEWATHKGQMREIIGAYNPSLVPRVRMVGSPIESEIKAVVADLRFPMIVKPTGLSGSSLVSKVNDEHELRRALHKSFTLIHEAYEREGGNGTPEIIVEEFINGDMYSADAYVDEYGKVWVLPILHGTTAHQLGRDGFYAYHWETDNGLSDDENDAGKDAAKQAIHALGLRSCLAHVELFKTIDNRWKICELGARPGGTRQEVYEVSYGVDHALNELLLKIGLEPEVNSELRVHSMVMNINAEEEGVVESIDGVEQAKNHPSVYKLRFFAKPGDMVKLNSNGGTAIGGGLMFNHDPEQLRRDSEAIRAMLRVNVHQPVLSDQLAHRID